MAGKNTPTYYWDSCILIALLQDEIKKHPHSIPAIQELSKHNSIGNISIIGCQLIQIEVGDWKFNEEQEASFQDFYIHDNNELFDVDIRIAQVSREIRGYYFRNPINPPKGNPRGPSIPDTIHLAAAIVRKADEFHTLDAGGQDGFSILQLSGNVAGYDLKICRPEDSQTLALGPLFDES